jgi:hypothetical protein
MLRDPLRLLAGAIVLVAAVASVRALDARFERADANNALRVVRTFRPPGAPDALPRRIARAHGVRPADLRWDAHVTSSVYGHVRVTCEVRVARPAVSYRFDVDLGRVAIHPADRATRRLLEAPVTTPDRRSPP